MFPFLFLEFQSNQPDGKDLPFVIDRFDDKPEGRAHGIHILPHDPLDDSCLARIIKTSDDTFSSTLFSLSFSRFPLFP